MQTVENGAEILASIAGALGVRDAKASPKESLTEAKRIFKIVDKMDHDLDTFGPSTIRYDLPKTDKALTKAMQSIGKLYDALEADIKYLKQK